MFREWSVRYFEPISMWLIILGIFGISQPWWLWLHRYGFTITLVGLIAFIVFSHIKPLPKARERSGEQSRREIER